MTPEELFKYYQEGITERGGCGGPMLAVIIICLFLLCGCKTQYIEVPVVHTEYITKTDTFIKKDSVYLKDSVYIHAKGDTVWYEKFHTQYVDRWRDRVVVDSFIRVDSVAQPYPVPAELTAWQKVKVDYGGWAMGIVAALVVFVVMRIKKKLIGNIV